MTKIKENVNYFAAHLKGEVDRMLEFVFRELANRKKEDNEVDQVRTGYLDEQFKIHNFELRSLKLEYKETFRDIHRAFKDMRNINRAMNGIKCFRWLFWFIFSAVLILGFFLIQWPDALPEEAPFYILAISIVSLILYGVFINITNGIIERTEKEYGV